MNTESFKGTFLSYHPKFLGILISKPIILVSIIAYQLGTQTGRMCSNRVKRVKLIAILVYQTSGYVLRGSTPWCRKSPFAPWPLVHSETQPPAIHKRSSSRSSRISLLRPAPNIIWSEDPSQ